MGAPCIGITSASHVEGPGFDLQCVHLSKFEAEGDASFSGLSAACWCACCVKSCVCVYTCEFRRGSTCMFVSGWGRRGGEDIVDTHECWARFPGAALSYVLSLAMRASHAMRRWWATQKHRGHRRTIARTPELPTTMEYRTSATAERNSAQPHTQLTNRLGPGKPGNRGHRGVIGMVPELSTNTR